MQYFWSYFAKSSHLSSNSKGNRNIFFLLTKSATNSNVSDFPHIHRFTWFWKVLHNDNVARVPPLKISIYTITSLSSSPTHIY